MTERKTVHKWWWVWDFEKEQVWLNNMAMEGWILESVSFITYHFAKGEPESYNICLVMLDDASGYRNFMTEIGAEYIGRVAKWQYYKRRTDMGPFEIFSDIDSKIEHLNRIARLLIIVGGLNILIGVMNSINALNVGFVNLLCGCLLMYGLGRIHGKIENLRAERLLHE